MKQHPPGRCLDQTCRGCWGAMVDKPVFPRPADQVDLEMRNSEYDRMLREDTVWLSRFMRPGPRVVRFITEPRPQQDAMRWDPTYCWICGGPCFLLAAWRRDNKPYENGNVIEGEVVHSHTQKELTS